ncbi:MAG: GTPase ObgE [Bacilli bacterium]|nr:GTPase ObgE [Bacilli bacterium]
MFIDEVIIELNAGRGGNGCMAFRREKYVEMGGPFGGNGGHGGDIIFEVDEGLNTLIDLRYKKIYKAKQGEHGEGKGCHGKNAEDLIIKVPLGTVITDTDTNLIIGDLTKKGDRVTAALGGRGGRGNMAFATRNNPAPAYCENGEPGEIKKVKVELKLLADVGLVGMPSVGKSTFISMVSAAKPKIAAYHFTTLSPNLGVVKTKDNRSFVVADLPGLIEGASLGEGLGDKFLKHIERTRVIAHIIDMSAFEGRDPIQDYKIINKELENFNKKIMDKPQIVIANKMDMESSLDNLEKFKKEVNCEVYPISAITGEGIDKVLIKLADMLGKIEKQPLYEEEKFESHVLYKFKKEQPFKIEKQGDVFVVTGDEIEKILRMTWFASDEAFARFSKKLRKLGIDDKLKEMGIEEGDTVRILDYEFEYKD